MASYAAHTCPNCGGPLRPPSATRAVRCTFCSMLLAPHPGGWRAAPADAGDEPLVDPELPRLWVGGHRYAVLGRIARGDACDVYRARRDARLTEHVLLKVPRTDAGTARLEREQHTLEALERSHARGAAHFTRLLPQRVHHGIARLGMNGRDGECHVSVMRWRAGFVHTFDDVLAAHPSGISAETSVWMWKRVLELLGWVHASGVVHGAILPGHMLVHARDHGVVLVGWSSSVRAGTPLEAVVSTERAYYPEAVWAGGAATVETDLAMSARVILRALGGVGHHAPASTPRRLAELLEAHAHLEAPPATDAWALRDRLDGVAREAFGLPKFVPFDMPGWQRGG